MNFQSHSRFPRPVLALFTAAAFMATGCTSGLVSSTGTTQTDAATGPAFLVGTDAPLGAVVSMQVTLEDVELTNGTSTTTTLVKGTPTVDFARFNGLQGLVDMVDVPAGTYTGMTLVLGSGTVGYLQTGSGAPTIQTAPAAFSSTTITVNFTNNLVVGDKTPPVGVRMDFDLADSIQVSNGQIVTNSSGAVEVDPKFNVITVARGDEGAHIDELDASVVSLPTSTTEPSSFVVQGPHGEQFTINTSSSTAWDGDASLSSLTTSSIVAVSGKLDPSDQTMDADEVAILSSTGFYSSGLVTDVTPSSGAASEMQYYVRSVEPSSLSEVPLGGIADVAITGNEKYYIYGMNNPLTNFLFNDAALTPGQEIALGGTDPTASPFDVKRIHLKNWGYNGTIVPKSQNSNAGTFQMKVTGFAGQVVPTTVTVYIGPVCDFRFGLGAFTDLADSTSIRVVGVLLNLNGNFVLVARHIDGIDLTDMTTTSATVSAE